LLKFSGSSINPVRTYIPQPEQCLTFNPRGKITAINRHTSEIQRRNYSYLSGQQTSCLDLYFDADYLMLKIVFQPGAIFQLLGIPLNEIADRYIDASSIVDLEMREVNQRLGDTDDYLKMIVIVEEYLIQKVRKIRQLHSPIEKIATIISNRPHKFTLAWFADQACLSPRQFERKFLERVGVRPKLYCRIARFYQAFEMKQNNPGLEWLYVAIACGYTDFQHLSKEFKEFSGQTPTALLTGQNQVVEKLLKLV
jgi:AraC-like DNA-binding protein